jgi:hypothetical protein
MRVFKKAQIVTILSLIETLHMLVLRCFRLTSPDRKY